MVDVVLRRWIYLPWCFAGGRVSASPCCIKDRWFQKLSMISPRTIRKRNAHVEICSEYIAPCGYGWAAPPTTMIELGAGDVSLKLRLARAVRPQLKGVALTLLDRRIVDSRTLQAFDELGWHTTVVCQDAVEWAQSTERARYDLCFATLFLH